jgi:hypothetical protein
MRNLTVLTVSLLLMLLSPWVWAVRVHSIYQAQVPVASQTPQKRSEAAKVGLAQVLAKVSGNTDILENKPSLKASLDKADTWIQEYSYATPPNPPKDLPYVLTIHFDPDAINRLLREAGSPIWGQNRPLVLVWLVVDGTNRSGDIVDSNTSGDVQTVLKHYAKQRGLPLIFPVMDVTDMSQVAANDIITKSLPKLQNAAKRYASDALLVGRVTQSDGGFTSQWQLVSSADQSNWDISGSSLDQVFSSVVNNVSDVFAKHYAMLTTDAVQSQLTLKVTGVKQQADLVQLMKYVQHLTPVADVELKSVLGDEILLDVNLRGSKQSFIQSLGLSKTLEPVPNTNTEGDTLVYQWTQ